MSWDFITTVLCINGLWLAWLTVWVVASRTVKRTLYRESTAARFSFAALLVLGVIIARHTPVFRTELFPPNLLNEGLGTLLTAAGLAWAIWARIHLGPNWSGYVTIKEQHELIQTGPYAITRHPIYTGILLAVLGTMLALVPTWGGAACMLLMLVAFVIRLLREEATLKSHFPEAYPSYKKRVRAALVPFLI